MTIKLNIKLLEKIHAYCDKLCYKSAFGFDKDSGNWDDSTNVGLIGIELANISSSIQHIFELLISESYEVSK